MIETKTRTIDGHEIVITPLTSMKALRLSAMLGAMLGTPLSKIVSTLDITSLDKLNQTDVTVLGAAMCSVFEVVTPDKLEEITRLLLGQATIDGRPAFPHFDIAFVGQVDTIYKVLAFALEANYGSFFGVFRGIGERARTAGLKLPVKSD